jgi:hypothetical protein
MDLANYPRIVEKAGRPWNLEASFSSVRDDMRGATCQVAAVRKFVQGRGPQDQEGPGSSPRDLVTAGEEALLKDSMTDLIGAQSSAITSGTEP